MKPNRMALALSGAFFALLLAGCADKKGDAPQTEPATPTVNTTTAPPVAATNGPKFTETPPDQMSSAAPSVDPRNAPSAAPFAKSGGMTAEDALKQVPTIDAKFVPMADDLAAKEAALKQSPNDAKAKSAYVESAYNYGHTLISESTKVGPTVQYRAALALYRRALKVDPTHGPSLAETKTIVDIYTQMGRPIPK